MSKKNGAVKANSSARIGSLLLRSRVNALPLEIVALMLSLVIGSMIVLSSEYSALLIVIPIVALLHVYVNMMGHAVFVAKKQSAGDDGRMEAFFVRASDIAFLLGITILSGTNTVAGIMAITLLIFDVLLAVYGIGAKYYRKHFAFWERVDMAAFVGLAALAAYWVEGLWVWNYLIYAFIVVQGFLVFAKIQDTIRNSHEIRYRLWLRRNENFDHTMREIDSMLAGYGVKYSDHKETIPSDEPRSQRKKSSRNVLA